MREQLSRARQTKTLEWKEHQQAVDIIAASGLSDELGNMLTRLKDNGDTSPYPKALKALQSRLNEFGKAPAAICKHAIYEYTADACIACQGRGLIILDNGVKIECHDCGGRKYRLWADDDRAKSLGVSVEIYRRKYAKTLLKALDIIHRSCRMYVSQSREKLG